jgi:hypothetical protein
MDIAAEEKLQCGSAILAPLLSKHGFTFIVRERGRSSGGNYAAGEFSRGTRRLELHFRHSLGMVQYHLGNRSMSHQAYMHSVLGRPFASNYPGFSDDPLDAFRHLYQDLEAHGQDFFNGTDGCLLNRIDSSLAFDNLSSYLPG